jgi:hypothetical protein
MSTPEKSQPEFFEYQEEYGDFQNDIPDPLDPEVPMVPPL